MKAFLTVIICVLLVNYSMCIKKKNVKMPPEAVNAVLLAVQKCMPETSVSADALLQAYQGGYNEEKNFKDFIYCCYKNTGFLKPDGYMNTEKAIKLFKDDSDVVDGVKRCGKETGRNAKEAVFNYFKCFQDTVPVRFTL